MIKLIRNFFTASVIGILAKNSTYPSSQKIKETLDNSHILPSTNVWVESYFVFSDYDLVISFAIVESDDPNEILQFVKKVNETGI